MVGGNKRGYWEEKNILFDLCIEIYIVMKLGISNWWWSGVFFYIRIGKQMLIKVIEIVVYFCEIFYQMFYCVGGNCLRVNKLILCLQFNEGIVLKFGMKVLGFGFEVKQVMMDFSYDQLGGVFGGDVYVCLIEDCILGDQIFFIWSDVVEVFWYFFDLILCYWNEYFEVLLYGYFVGIWGFLESEVMMYEYGVEWINLCKNLINID